MAMLNSSALNFSTLHANCRTNSKNRISHRNKMDMAAKKRAKPSLAHLPVRVPDQVKAFFVVATISEVRGGKCTGFLSPSFYL
jgi:hypothetical protein